MIKLRARWPVVVLGIVLVVMVIEYLPLQHGIDVASVIKPTKWRYYDTAMLAQSTANDRFRILIGIMSPFWSSGRRQTIRHAYSRFPKNLPVDIVYVEGDLDASSNLDKVLAAQRTAIAWENSTYHDIMHLNCTENMNEGKTYEFLKKVGQEFGHRYTHVMKTDDDAFVNIPGRVPLHTPSN